MSAINFRKSLVLYSFFFLLSSASISAQTERSDTLKTPNLRIGIKLLQLINFLEEHREAALYTDKRIVEKLYFTGEAGFSFVGRDKYAVNLNRYESKGLYGKIGAKKLFNLDKVIADVGLLYVFSQSRELNEWYFPSNYWNSGYLQRENQNTFNQGIAGNLAFNFPISKRIHVAFSKTLCFRIDNAKDSENFKRVFYPGMGYAAKYDWLTKKNQRLFYEISLGLVLNI